MQEVLRSANVKIIVLRRRRKVNRREYITECPGRAKVLPICGRLAMLGLRFQGYTSPGRVAPGIAPPGLPQIRT